MERQTEQRKQCHCFINCDSGERGCQGDEDAVRHFDDLRDCHLALEEEKDEVVFIRELIDEAIETRNK